MISIDNFVDATDFFGARGGVYMFVDDNRRPVYIGRSLNVVERVRGTIRGGGRNKHGAVVDELYNWRGSILVCWENDEFRAAAIETLYIAKYQPPLNKNGKNFFYPHKYPHGLHDDVVLTRVMKKMIDDHRTWRHIDIRQYILERRL